MNADLIQAALKDILAEKQDHVAGSIAHQRMERAEAALRGVLPEVQEGRASAEELAKDLSRPMVDISPPASLRDRQMYEQGRLAERDPRTPGSLASQLALSAGQAPAGYKLVPLEPNDAMQAAGPGAIRWDTTILNKIWTANAVYRAMVAAAPRPPEVSPAVADVEIARKNVEE